MINADLDNKASAIKSIESFTDRYIPVRILYVIREAFKAISTRQQMQKYEVWERLKLRKIHESLASDEPIPDILTIIKQILADVNEIIQQYKD